MNVAHQAETVICAGIIGHITACMIGHDKEIKYSYSGISDSTAVLPELIFIYVTYLPEMII